MHITRALAAKAFFALMLAVMGAGYYFTRTPAIPPPAVSPSVSGVDSSSCGQFAATYEHNATDPNHTHDFNAYGIDETQAHAHVTADYRDWLMNNMSGFVTGDTPEKYRTTTSLKVAGMLYALYRVCRVNPGKSFVTAVDALMNNRPGLRPADSYVEGSDGE